MYRDFGSFANHAGEDVDAVKASDAPRHLPEPLVRRRLLRDCTIQQTVGQHETVESHVSSNGTLERTLRIQSRRLP